MRRTLRAKDLNLHKEAMEKCDFQHREITTAPWISLDSKRSFTSVILFNTATSDDAMSIYTRCVLFRTTHHLLQVSSCTSERDRS